MFKQLKHKVTEVWDLGITVDSKLSFIPHLNDIIKRAFRISALIKRTMNCFKTQLAVWLYLTLCHIAFLIIVLWYETLITRCILIDWNVSNVNFHVMFANGAELWEFVLCLTPNMCKDAGRCLYLIVVLCFSTGLWTI